MLKVIIPFAITLNAIMLSVILAPVFKEKTWINPSLLLKYFW